MLKKNRRFIKLKDTSWWSVILKVWNSLPIWNSLHDRGLLLKLGEGRTFFKVNEKYEIERLKFEKLGIYWKLLKMWSF